MLCSEMPLFSLSALPSSRGEDMQMKCLLELYGLKVCTNWRQHLVELAKTQYFTSFVINIAAYIIATKIQHYYTFYKELPKGSVDIKIRWVLNN